MTYRYPFSPFPDGWFFVCYSHELPAGKLFDKTFMGKPIVAFRGDSGQVCVADAHCPHLGAHLARGGCVIDGTVRCPFHGFRFDEQGHCVSTPYSDPPKAGQLKLWPTREVDGFIFAYHAASGAPPHWELPGEHDASGWSALDTRYFRLRGHPQETTENGVDLAHLQVVHGYDNVEIVSAPQMDGPYLTGAYSMRRDAGPLNRLHLDLRSHFRVHVWGLGYSFVEVSVPAYQFFTRQWIFATPSDGEYIDLHIAIRVKGPLRIDRIFGPLRHLPQRAVTRVARELAMKAFETDIAQDFDIWENKSYVSPPALVKGDGPIGLYRRYCRQFYPDPRGPALKVLAAGE